MITREEFRTAIQSVVDYNWPDESRDFETRKQEGEDVSSHVFRALMILSEALAEGVEV